jgi:hypothetical protein
MLSILSFSKVFICLKFKFFLFLKCLENKNGDEKTKLIPVPQEKEFFTLFEKQAQKLFEVSKILDEILNNFSDRQKIADEFSNLEHSADEITHRLIEKLNKTFITPFDREDIHFLAHEIDDIIDLTEAAVGKMLLYKIESLTPELKEQIRTLKNAIILISELTKSLNNLNELRKQSWKFVEVNHLENQGDKLLREALNNLINGSSLNAVFDFIRWKEVYESLEEAIDKCEDVANIIESILIKNS